MNIKFNNNVAGAFSVDPHSNDNNYALGILLQPVYKSSSARSASLNNQGSSSNSTSNIDITTFNRVSTVFSVNFALQEAALDFVGENGKYFKTIKYLGKASGVLGAATSIYEF